MKKKRLLSLTLATAILFGSAAMLPEGAFGNPTSITACAEGETSGKCGENVYWSFDNGVLTISGSGKMDDYEIDWTYPPFRGYTNDITSIVIGYGVEHIGEDAFYDTSVTNVTIPDSVTSIGGGAFCGCDRLTSVTIPDSVTSIGYGAFGWCKNLTSINIPDSVTSIGGGAFRYCPWAEQQYLDAIYATYGDYSYDLCDDGTIRITKYNGTGGNIRIPSYLGGKRVTIIDNRAFEGCSNLQSVIIPDGVTTIGRSAFSSCKYLTSVSIPDSVTTIGDSAFSQCTRLTSVTIPSSVTTIGINAFSHCSSLTSVTIPDSVTSIGEYAFSSCKSLTSITIPNSVTNIGKCAFESTAWLDKQKQTETMVIVNGILINGRNCKGNVVIPDGVTTICGGAFSSCYYLTSVTIPDSVTTIGEDAFYYCNSLTSIAIPNSVTTIGDGAFSSCSRLASITIPNSVTSIGEKAFESTAWLDKQKENDPMVIVNGILINGRNCKGNVVIPDGVTTICGGAFFSCINLTSVTIPNSVTTIGKDAFFFCSSLTSVTIPNSVTSIGDYAFSSCYNLTSVTIPNSVTTIGDEAFHNCINLASINVGSGNMYYCSVDGVLYDKNKTILIKCPQNKTNVTIPTGVVSISEHAFSATKLTSIAIPNSVVNIGAFAFANCDYLTNVSIPNSVTTIGSGAFQESNKVRGTLIPSRATNIVGGMPNMIKCYRNTVAYHAAIKENIACEILTECPHSYRIISSQQPTCTSLGYSIYRCSKCGDEYRADYTDFAPHTWSSWVTTKQATYTQTGLEKHTCSKCNFVESRIIPIIPHTHKYISTIDKKATCTEKGIKRFTCSFCSNTYTEEIAMVAHSWGSWVVTKPATYTTEGIKVRTCATCDKTESETIPKIEHVHDYTSVVTKEPTCTASGTKKYTCKLCNATYTEKISPAGHSWGEWVVTKPATDTSTGLKVHTCLVCDKTETETIPKVEHVHEYTSVISKEPTCTASGTRKYSCKLCDSTYTETIPPTGHSWGEWITTKRPTETKTGVKVHTCLKCNTTETSIIPVITKTRLAGSGRYETAAKISQAAFDQANTVVLAYGLNYADALAGVSLATKMNAPILLTNLKTLPAETLAEIKRLKATDVIILGGTGAVGAEVETALIKEGFKTERIAGATRFETATKIAEKMQKLNDKAPEEVYFVYAFNSADALSVSPIAACKNAPIIYLTTKGELNADTAAYLAKLKKAGSVKNAYVIGGEGVISNDMMKKAGDALGVTPIRVFGANRFETCVAVNERFADVLDGDMLCVATGMDFPDALAGGVYAALNKAPLFLINGKVKTPNLSVEQKAYLKAKSAAKITAFGGVGVVPDNHIADIAKISI